MQRPSGIISTGRPGPRPDDAMSDSAKIGELESVRGLAALLVVLFHVPGWNPELSALPLMRNTYLMVELFFVLSGFVMYINYADRLRTGRDVLRFQWLRFGRLYPVHILFLLVFLGIECLRWVMASEFDRQPGQEAPFSKNNAQAFVEHLFLAHALGFSDNSLTFNYPSWSISVEFYTYLLFAAICLFATRFKLAIFVLLSVVCVAATLVVKSHAPLLDSLLKCFAGFFLGCVVGAVHLHNRLEVPRWSAALLMLAFGVFVWFKPSDALVFLLAAALILSLIRSPDNAVKRFLRLPPLIWLGKVSYSVYMCHAAVLWGMSQIVRFVLRAPEAQIDGRMIPQLGIAMTIVMIAANFIVLLVLSHWVHKLVEEPGRIRARRLVGLR